MNDNQKTFLKLICLIVVIGGAFAFLYMKMGIGAPKLPPTVTGRMIEKADCETGELITKTYSEWQALGSEQDYRYKNPKTGKFTMVNTLTCRSCGAHIPYPLHPDNYDAMNPDEQDRWYSETMDAYICLQCKKPAAKSE